MYAYTLVYAATARYLSLSQALFILKGLTAPSSEGAEAAPPQAAEFALPSTEGAEKRAALPLWHTSIKM